MNATSTSEPKRLCIFLDGTGNAFQGNESDTNIVKLFQMLDRRDPNQFHYYQPGIGTYSETKLSNLRGPISSAISNASSGLDQAIGTSFVDHVSAAYKFLMRYYEDKGNSIYLFGFSRGAYTARFLAEMLHTIGLLSRGNEEMIHFAWETFSEFQKNRGDETKSAQVKEKEAFMVKFKETFCRPNVNVHFLGLFDCVNSVGQFEIPMHQRSYKYIPRPPAKHVRHAVAIHERRLKFKPALFVMDDTNLSNDTVEMWFAGNHADVGGGWSLQPNQTRLLSDAPLNWMIEELMSLPEKDKRLSFTKTRVERQQLGETKFDKQLSNGLASFKENLITLRPHDMLSFGGGVGTMATMMWWIIEVLPIFTRLELEGGEWVPRHWPANMGAPRDIPSSAKFHKSFWDLVRAGVLTEKDIPHLGGDNAHINPAGALLAWTRNREELANEKVANAINGVLKATSSIANGMNSSHVANGHASSALAHALNPLVNGFGKVTAR